MTSNNNILKITYPILITLLMQNAINVTNTAFLGRVGEVELGASAIGGVFYMAIYMIGFGFSQGVQILIGRRNGEKNYLKIGHIFNNGLIFNLVLSFIIFLLSIVGIPILMKYSVSSIPVYNATIEYLDWRIYGYFFSFASAIFRSFYVGITQTRILTISAIIMALTNIILDYILIFGNFGFAKMGIEGAGISSFVSEIVAFTYIVWYTRFRVDIKRYGLFEFKKVDFNAIKHILDISIFIMFQYFISISTWFLFFIFIEHMGERQLAVSNIVRSLYVLLMIPASALATTVTTLVSNLIGAGRKAEVLPFVNRIAVISLIIVLPIMILAVLFPDLFAHIYTDNEGLIKDCLPSIKIVAFANIVFAISFVVFNGIIGTGNTRTAFLIEFITLFFYISYVYYTAIVNPSSVAIVWMSEFVYWGIIFILGYLYLWKGNWMKKQI